MPTLTLNKILIWPQHSVFNIKLTQDEDCLSLHYATLLNTQY